jgi:hypothetical protein
VVASNHAGDHRIGIPSLVRSNAGCPAEDETPAFLLNWIDCLGYSPSAPRIKCAKVQNRKCVLAMVSTLVLVATAKPVAAAQSAASASTALRS